MSWLKGLTESLGLTSTGPSSATLQQIKEAPVGTQSLGEQRLSAFEGDLEKAFRPLVRGWQPGQAPLTQEQYDKIQRASIDLFDKLGYLNPMGSQPSRVAAASMRKGTRPPPRTYTEAKTPQATEVEFQHASPHKFTNVDVENPLGRFDEAHLLKGEGATVYGPGAAYVSTSEPTHRSYMKQFAERFAYRPIIENALGDVPQNISIAIDFTNPKTIKQTLPQGLEYLKQQQAIYADAITRAESRKALDMSKLPLDRQAARAAAWDREIAGNQQALQDLKADFEYLEKLKNFDYSKVPALEGPYSYRGSLAEDPARTVLFEKPLSEQLPEVQAALARASSQARKDIGSTRNFVLEHPTNPWADQAIRSDLEKYFVQRVLNTPENKKMFANARTAYDNDFTQQVSWYELSPVQQLAYAGTVYSPDSPFAKLVKNSSEQVKQQVERYARNPKLAAKLPGLDANLQQLLAETKMVPQTKADDIFAPKSAGEYIKNYRASPKTVQRLRDAGIDLIKYMGSSQSPNYVVLNPAAAKIRSRTPSIAATVGTGEFARQLYESIYGKGSLDE